MSLSSDEKPFYFQPPWNIFFELHKLSKTHLWEIGLRFLLESFLQEMENRGEVDFRASGVAINSSATIFLMKAKLLLKLEEQPVPPVETSHDFVPQPLFLPLRYELTSTTIQHLLKALDEVLTGERLFALKPRSQPIPLPPPEVLPPVDLYLMEIEEEMKKLFRFLSQLSGEKKLIVFSKIIAGLKHIEAIKTFITLLFLAQKGVVSLWQDERVDEIYITLLEAPAVGA